MRVCLHREYDFMCSEINSCCGTTCNKAAVIAEIADLRKQNAELVATVNNMRSALELAFISVKTCYKQDLAPFRDVVAVEKAIKSAPAQHLRDHDAEVGRNGYQQGIQDWRMAEINYESFDITFESTEYAESIRRGEV
jgi:hypothetical protein